MTEHAPTEQSGVPPPVQRCAGFARSENLVPAGTAGSTRGFAVVELPLPWPREITDHPAVAPARAALAASGVRVQALVPGPASTPQRRHLLWLTRPPGGFDRYTATPLTVTDADLPGALERLAAVAGDDPAAALGDPAAGAGSSESPIGPHDRHVLVCAHGRRDACCGRFGTRLSAALPGLGAGVHLWRTSHTGGHRFAPTALLLPEGTAWAYLDVDTLSAIADRTLGPDIAARLYRGCTGLDGIEVQAADGEVLRTLGWEWLDHRRAGEVIRRDGARTEVEITGETRGGKRRRFRATVEVTRVLPVPDCGKPLAAATKSAPELRVTQLSGG